MSEAAGKPFTPLHEVGNGILLEVRDSEGYRSVAKKFIRMLVLVFDELERIGNTESFRNRVLADIEVKI